MLTENKTIYGPYRFYIDNGETTDGTKGAYSDTDGEYGYKVTGLQKDSISINETVDKEELEDGVERELMRKLEIVLTFSEVDETDIADIQGYGDGNLNHAVIQFPTATREITVEDGADAGDDNIKYTAELEDGKMKITIAKTTSNVDNAVIDTDTSLTTYSAPA